MNRHQRRAQARCRACRHRPGLRGTPYCCRCVEDTREHYRCPDCDSIVTVTIAEGVHSLWVDLRHDPTCPTWRAKSGKAAST